MDNGKGVPIPGRYTVWERRELLQQGPGQSSHRKRIWLLYCCECYTGDNYVDDSEAHVSH